LSRQLPRAAT
ncbi:TPR repeat family protein, partial [Vibrio parahaemolyticus V-223/04]